MFSIRNVDGAWQVLDASGQILATHDTRDAAVTDLTARFAAVDATDDTSGAPAPVPFSIPIMALVGEPTGDRRQLDSVTWRTPPLPLMCQTCTDIGHDGATIVGRIDTIRIDGNTVSGEGVFDTSEAALDAARLAATKMLYGISVDPGGLDSVEIEVIEEDEDGWPTDWIEHYVGYQIAGATICAFPAFENAYIEVDEADLPQAVAASAAPARRELPDHADPATASLLLRDGTPAPTPDLPLIAAATATPIPRPPRAWFDDPEFGEPTPLTVTDDGRVFGHAALWGTCHIGRTDACVTPPQSATNYSYFRKGAVRTDGGLVATGALTVDTGHAALHLNATDAAAHYDNTGHAVADVAAGEDAHGIWFAGAVRPHATDAQVHDLLAGAISGDWRPIGMGLELVAMLGVNVPGYPVVRTRVAGGQCLALVAAGGKPLAMMAASNPREMAALRQELASLRASVGPVLAERARARLAAARADRARARLARASR